MFSGALLFGSYVFTDNPLTIARSFIVTKPDNTITISVPDKSTTNPINKITVISPPKTETPKEDPDTSVTDCDASDLALCYQLPSDEQQQCIDDVLGCIYDNDTPAEPVCATDSDCAGGELCNYGQCESVFACEPFVDASWTETSDVTADGAFDGASNSDYLSVVPTDTDSYALRAEGELNVHRAERGVYKNFDQPTDVWGGSMDVNFSNLVHSNVPVLALFGAYSDDTMNRDFAVYASKLTDETRIMSFNAYNYSNHAQHFGSEIPLQGSPTTWPDRFVQLDWYFTPTHNLFIQVDNQGWQQVDLDLTNTPKNFLSFMTGWVSSYNGGSIDIREVKIYDGSCLSHKPYDTTSDLLVITYLDDSQFIANNPFVLQTTVDNIGENHATDNYLVYDFDEDWLAAVTDSLPDNCTTQSGNTLFCSLPDVSIHSNETIEFSLIAHEHGTTDIRTDLVTGIMEANLANNRTIISLEVNDFYVPAIEDLDAGPSANDRNSFMSEVPFDFIDTESDNEISFSWNDPLFLPENTFYYEINNTSTLNTIIGDEASTENTYVDDMPIQPGYSYFHIKPLNGSDVWGDEKMFLINYNEHPVEPTILYVDDTNAQTGSPGTNIHIQNQTPLFSALFNDPNVNNATHTYRLQIDDNHNFENPISDQDNLELNWSKRLGDTGVDMGYDAKINSNNEVIVTGTLSGDIDLTVFNQTGTILWNKRFGGLNSDAGQSITTDSDNNIYVTGYVKEDADLNGDGDLYDNYESGLGFDSNDIFISVFDDDGNHMWSKRLGGLASDQGYGVTVGNDSVVITGMVNGSADLSGDGDYNDTGESTSNFNTTDAFVSSFDMEGNYQWSRRLGGMKNDEGHAITSDSEGNVYITGSITEDADLNGDGDTSDNGEAGIGYGYEDIFISSFDATGNHRWTHRLGSIKSYDIGYDITVDNLNNVIVTGSINEDADLNGDGDTNDNNESASGYENTDIFISVFDNNGNHLWAERLGGTSYDYGYSVATDDLNSIIISGAIVGDSDLNGDGDTNDNNESGTGYGGSDIFISVFSNSGNHLWNSRLGGLQHDRGYGIDANTEKDVTVTGFVYNHADFNGDGDRVDQNEFVQQNQIYDSFIASFNRSKLGILAPTTAGSRSPDITYSGPELTVNTEYFYRLKFFDDGNAEGAWSTEATSFIINPVTTPDTTPPKVSISNLASRFSSAPVSISGTASDSDSGLSSVDFSYCTRSRKNIFCWDGSSFVQTTFNRSWKDRLIWLKTDNNSTWNNLSKLPSSTDLQKMNETSNRKLYFIYARATDSAGNTAYAKDAFRFLKSKTSIYKRFPR